MNHHSVTGVSLRRASLYPPGHLWGWWMHWGDLQCGARPRRSEEGLSTTTPHPSLPPPPPHGLSSLDPTGGRGCGMNGVQGCLGRRSSPGTRRSPQDLCPRARPSPPCFHPPTGNTPGRAQLLAAPLPQHNPLSCQAGWLSRFRGPGCSPDLCPPARVPRPPVSTLPLETLLLRPDWPDHPARMRTFISSHQIISCSPTLQVAERLKAPLQRPSPPPPKETASLERPNTPP